MKIVLEYCYFFCYQSLKKIRNPEPRGNAVFLMALGVLSFGFLATIILLRISKLFIKSGKIEDPAWAIIFVLSINFFIWYKLGSYFKIHHDRIVNDQFNPVRTTGYLDALIIMGVLIGQIALAGVVSFVGRNH